ncbi:MAG: class I SAM-dependent methyltransferase [Thermodesulfobacteriota bacterium]
MAIPSDFSYLRYLAAKRSVDDRALNRYVLEHLKRGLGRSGQTPPAEVLEIGAGSGAMLERLARRGILKRARYEAIDLVPEHIGEARRLLPLWARDLGFTPMDETGAGLRLERGTDCLAVRFEAIDVHAFIRREAGRRRWDLLVSHAFLDLVDAGSVLPGLLSLVSPGGLLYLTMNFDGVTILEPPLDPALDEAILALYHATMDNRRVGGHPSGDSRTGRRLLGRLGTQGVEIAAAGSSDWVIHPAGGRYPYDEAYFLHFIVNLIDASVKGHPSLDPGRLSRWIGARHAQIEQGALILIAHQIDILGRRS